MKMIENIKNLDINITWRLLYIAVQEKMISPEDVIEYAADILKNKFLTTLKLMIEWLYVNWLVQIKMTQSI